MTRAFLQPAQTVARPTHKRRSVVRSLGRGTVRLYTASWWRKAKFSRASWRWPPNRKGRSRSRWSRRRIIELGLCPDESRQINHLPPAEILAKGRAARRAARETDVLQRILRTSADRGARSSVVVICL